MNISTTGNVSLAPKNVIFKEGAPAAKLFLIKSGEVLCLKKFDDRLIPIYLARSEDIIGESALQAGQLYHYSAVTTSPVELIEIPSDMFQQAFEAAPDWLLNLTTTMLERFNATVQLVAENRLIHSSVIPEENFTPEVEVDYRKLLS
jgi:CRP-like cAMP-binding protein